MQLIQQYLLQPLANFWHKEWTTVWGWLLSGVGAFGALVNDTGVKATLPDLHLPPYVMTALAIAGAITLLSQAH